MTHDENKTTDWDFLKPDNPNPIFDIKNFGWLIPRNELNDTPEKPAIKPPTMVYEDKKTP